jgi:hypothetical protein
MSAGPSAFTPPLGVVDAHTGGFDVEPTASVDRNAWDRFVEGHEFGQFQQSAAWAETKAIDGWNARWLIARANGPDARIVAGAQVLVKQTRAGAVGFVNKGPLAGAAGTVARAAVARQLVELAHSENLRLLLVQPPDRDADTSAVLESLGFGVDTLLPLITSTLCIDVSKPMADVERQLRKDRRSDIRQAARRNVIVEEGGDSDVPRFFELMVATCRHQQTHPNPGTLAAARALWSAFHRRGQARLTFAQHDGRTVATALFLAFGDRVTIWKVGWDRTVPAAHANSLLAWDGMRWAHARGSRWFDFGAIDRDIAEARVGGTLTVAAIDRRRDVFKLGFGGEAWLLPRPLVYFASPPLRTLHRWAQKPLGRRVIRRFGAAPRLN